MGRNFNDLKVMGGCQGKFELEHRDITLWLKGSPNQRVIDMNETRKQNKIILLKKDGTHEEYH